MPSAAVRVRALERDGGEESPRSSTRSLAPVDTRRRRERSRFARAEGGQRVVGLASRSRLAREAVARSGGTTTPFSPHSVLATPFSPHTPRSRHAVLAPPLSPFCRQTDFTPHLVFDELGDVSLRAVDVLPTAATTTSTRYDDGAAEDERQTPSS